VKHRGKTEGSCLIEMWSTIATLPEKTKTKANEQF